MKAVGLSVSLVVFACPAFAQDQTRMVFVKPEALNWMAVPSMGKGAQAAELLGDSSKAGEYVLRIKIPANFKIMAHTHPDAETVTVLSGSFGIGMGERFTPGGDLLKAGALFTVPARHAHFAWTGPEETIIQVNGVGPSGTEYINPADDPRKVQ